MACFHPVQGWQLDGGTVVFGGPSVAGGRSLLLPCGQCVGCRLEKSRQWAMRAMHEASLHAQNCAVLLTYSPEAIPPGGALRYRDYQLFMKRLRRKVGPVRFYMCGEYGTQNLRPHYHAIFFGYDFPDKLYIGKSPAGSELFSSAALNRLWGFGQCSVGEANFKSAAYIARHNLAKVNGPLADANYERIDMTTSEIIRVPTEFNRMSLGGRGDGGIGFRWFNKYSSDVYPVDRCVVNGREVRPPKYYDALYKRRDRVGLEEIKAQREYKSYVSETWKDNVPERLSVRELVVKARLKYLKRDYS